MKTQIDLICVNLNPICYLGNILVCMYASMKYESAVVNGMIEDFATVLLFLIDIFVFHMPFSVWSLTGCFLIGYVVVSISLHK